MRSWMSRREDWGRREMWRVDPGHEVPVPQSMASKSSSDTWNQNDYRPQQTWNERNYYGDDQHQGGYQHRSYRRQYMQLERFGNRGGRGQGQSYRGSRGDGRPYRGRKVSTEKIYS